MMNVGMNEAVCGRKLNFCYFSCKDSGFFLEHRLFLSDIELGMLMSVWIITDFEEHNGINKPKKNHLSWQVPIFAQFRLATLRMDLV